MIVRTSWKTDTADAYQPKKSRDGWGVHLKDRICEASPSKSVSRWNRRWHTDDMEKRKKSY
jgi:hypothetical protein